MKKRNTLHVFMVYASPALSRRIAVIRGFELNSSLDLNYHNEVYRYADLEPIGRFGSTILLSNF